MNTMRSALVAVGMLILASQAFADVKKGQDAVRNGDFETAREEFLKSAEKGDPVAQYNLGVIYRRGQGVAQDYAEAAKWFALAAEKKFIAPRQRLAACIPLAAG